MKNEINFKQKLIGADLFEKNSTNNSNETSSFYLSYMGDALFELWCRQKILQRYQNRKLVHNYVVKLVRCQTQSQIATIILPVLAAVIVASSSFLRFSFLTFSDPVCF